MGPKRLTQFLRLAGSLALAIAQGIVLLVILLIMNMNWLHGEPRSTLSSRRLGRGMKEQDRWEGFAHSTRYAAIPLRASPRKTR